MRRYKQSEIELIIKALKEDSVISVPTDTVYGLCVRVNSSKAFHKLVEVKSRPSTKSFPVMCSDLEQIKSIAIVDERSEKLINVLMPGPVTLVLKKKKDTFLHIINAGVRETDEIAIRMATSLFLKNLINGVGVPLFMTSANKSGDEECRSLDDIEKMCPMIDGMVEGNVSLGEASTIIDCTGEDIKIQRPGPISEEQIIEILNK